MPQCPQTQQYQQKGTDTITSNNKEENPSQKMESENQVKHQKNKKNNQCT